MLGKIFGAKAGYVSMAIIFVLAGCQALGWIDPVTSGIIQGVLGAQATGALAKAKADAGKQ